MPRIAPEKVGADQLYGANKVDTSISFRERMKKLFRPGETVKVRNITDQMLRWQWFNEEDETYTIEDDTNIKIIDREDPQAWELGPGEVDYITGSNAYLMLDAQYKMICVMKIGVVLHPLDEREIRNFSLDDPEKQEQFLKMAFVGKMDQGRISRVIAADGDGTPKVLEHLRPLSTEESEYERRHHEETKRFSRPQTTAAPHKELADLASEFDAGEPLLGRATGGLPDDRRTPAADIEEEPKPETAVTAKKETTKKEPAKV